jgi:NAD(P)-dependent dehydrogenase (short-subunit alcohol dehydrogenase family)
MQSWRDLVAAARYTPNMTQDTSRTDAGRFANVLITGASSGIGAALARRLARPGAVLHLSGRNAGRLEDVAESCRARGAEVHARVLRVEDAAAMRGWIAGAGYLDLVVANAGISAGTGNGAPESEAQARAVFAVNLDGVLNTVLPALEVAQAQPEGVDGWRCHIAVVSSVAAFVAAPGAPAYCASKAAADAWTVGAAVAARKRGVLLTSICPGYVRTAMTARNRFPMPGLMDADRAAGIILRGLARGRRRIVFPWWMGLAARLAGLLPLAWSMRLLDTVPGKDALD